MKSIRLSPIICAVLTLASAVLYFVFPSYTPVNMEMTKQHEFILAFIALGCAVLSLLVFLVANRGFFRYAPRWQQHVAHLFALFVQLFILTQNSSRLIKAFKYDFVPVMHTNTVGVWMLVLAALLIIGGIFHPRKETPETDETEV